MLENNGIYPGDPPMHKIYKYNHANGQQLHACFRLSEHDDMAQSPHVNNPVLLMENGQLTDAGDEYLATLQKETMDITVTCPNCTAKRTITVSKAGHKAWMSGTLIQNAFPDLSKDDREGLMTGICPTCWNKMFKDEA